MKEIICLSNEPWSSNPGRTQQLVTRLRDTKILYFSPSPSPRDISWRKPGKRVRPNVTVFTLPPVFTQEERLRHLFAMGQRRRGAFIQDRIDRNRFRDALLWTTNPAHVHLLDQLEYGALVYDCDRVWDETPGAWEGTLANQADVVFTASAGLKERLSPCSSNIALLPNGVNFSMFSGANRNKRARLLPQIHGPLLGWVGTVWDDLDLSPLLYAAQERPDWTFLVMGHCQGDNPWVRRARKLPNVIFRNACPLPEVPEWLERCDVLLDFLRTTRPYSDVVPVRLYEYFSTGKPVVSMLWPDQVELFPDVVYAAYYPEELVTMCQQALQEDPGFVSQRRRDYGERAAWPNRSDEMARILMLAGLL